MKPLLTSVLVVLSATLIVAVPSARPDIHALNSALDKLTRRDGIESCDECADHLGMCMTYATAVGITGCEDSCMSRLCRKWPDCRNCDEKYNHCTERDV
ncbi:hypothetical protein K458DRAFT_389165 [Lentithecium fluviatile CBS 122367]|uniref:Uncharacterized protein n=1 Tax=Lentithecium fluviatile CBS 122367 TaxID=1168545 RepID=A0A6G1J148_9PLEO|nr:hypothetical protein K458DRAFT_389165 [Lentithecium fluviatile CBS 122367]